ncbi:MAG: glyoxalase, partial [Caldilinea sp.]|nr:glyoxalase [Caldilinea sp.]
AWYGMVDETDIGHVHLKVADLKVAKHFYVDTLGFETKTEVASSALFVAAGVYHHHIGLNTWHTRGAASSPADALGLARFELLFPHESAQESIVNSLRKVDYRFERHTDRVHVRDPFGIAIVLRVPDA